MYADSKNRLLHNSSLPEFVKMEIPFGVGYHNGMGIRTSDSSATVFVQAEAERLVLRVPIKQEEIDIDSTRMLPVQAQTEQFQSGSIKQEQPDNEVKIRTISASGDVSVQARMQQLRDVSIKQEDDEDWSRIHRDWRVGLYGLQH